MTYDDEAPRHRRKPREATLNRVFERLAADTFDGTREELAIEIGIGVHSLQEVLDWVRTPEFIDENHWTIPYVRRGGQTNRWRIVDTEDRADHMVMKDSQQRRAQEMLQTTRRNIGQAALISTALDGRSREGRHWHRVMVALQAAEAHLEQLLER